MPVAFVLFQERGPFRFIFRFIACYVSVYFQFENIEFSPLTCWYIRATPINNFLYRIFPRIAPTKFMKIPARKLSAHYDKDGNLEYVNATKTIFFDIIGNTMVDREYAAQLNSNNFDRTYWKAEDLANMANFADLSLEKMRVSYPSHAGKIDQIQEQGSAQEGVEKAKRPGSDYG